MSIEDPPCKLGEWSRSACLDNGSVAEDVDGLAVDHAQTLQEDVKYALAWVAEDGTVVTSKRIAVKYAPELVEDGAENEALGIVGSERGILTQMQRHSEAMTRMYLSAHQTQVQMLGTLVRDLGSQLNDSHSRTHNAHLEINRMHLVHRREVERMADDAVPQDVESSARAGMIETITQAFQAALPMLLQGGMQLIAAKVVASQASPANDTAPPQAKAS